MKKSIVFVMSMLCPLLAQANCFKTDISTIDRNHIEDKSNEKTFEKYLDEISARTDYSKCTTAELVSARDIMNLLVASAASDLQKDGAERGSANMTIGVVKAN